MPAKRVSSYSEVGGPDVVIWDGHNVPIVDAPDILDGLQVERVLADFARWLEVTLPPATA